MSIVLPAAPGHSLLLALRGPMQTGYAEKESSRNEMFACSWGHLQIKPMWLLQRRTQS